MQSNGADRLDKVLSHQGFGTRSDIKKLVHHGAVTVNGAVAGDFSMKVDLARDEVCVDGERVSEEAYVYLMMNKPQNYVCANKDGLHDTVFDLLGEKYHTPYLEEHLHLIGRLDIDTEGLLVFTTDGDLTHRVTSPRTHLPKTYFVRLRDQCGAEAQRSYTEQCAAGIHIPPEGNEAEADCRSAGLVWQSGTECELTISEGKFHQVKRMFAALGNEVVYLKRISIGELKLDESLALGKYREMREREIVSINEKWEIGKLGK